MLRVAYEMPQFFAARFAALADGTPLRDATDRMVARGRMPADPRRGGRLQVQDARLWWPQHMAEAHMQEAKERSEVLAARVAALEDEATALGAISCACWSSSAG